VKSVINEDKVHILPAPNEAEEGLGITGSAFAQIIQHCRALDYDMILVNTSPYVSDPTFSALDAADLIIVVVTQEISSVRAARAFFNLMANLQLGRGKVKVILNRFTEASSLLPQKIGEILGQKIALSIPADGATAVRAANLGVPFVVDYKDQPISKAIVNLAAQLDSAGEQVESVVLEEAQAS